MSLRHNLVAGMCYDKPPRTLREANADAQNMLHYYANGKATAGQLKRIMREIRDHLAQAEGLP